MSKKSTDSSIRVLQWNARSLGPKVAELRQLVSNTRAHILAVQESKMKEGSRLRIPGYTVEKVNAVGVAGGLITLIREDIKYDRVGHEQNENYESLTIKVFRDKTSFLVKNVYVRHEKNVTESEMEDLICTPNSLTLGDFNCHNTLWGSQRNSVGGKKIEEIMVENNLIIYNTGETTRIGNENQRGTAIDLTIATSDFACGAGGWERHSDTLGSDHYPILTTFQGSNPSEDEITCDYSSKLSINKIDWIKLNEILKNVEIIEERDINAYEENVRKTLEQAINASVKTNSSNNKKFQGKNRLHRPKYWWNEKCQEAVDNRQKELKRYTKEKNRETWERYRTARNRATAVITKTKKDSWQEFITNIDINRNP